MDAREFDAVCNEELAEIEGRRERYLGDRARAEVKDEVVIAVDDGIATSILAAVRAVREWKPKELVLAVPVAPLDAIKKLHPEVDAIVCLDTPEELGAVAIFTRSATRR